MLKFALAKKDRHVWLARFLKQVNYLKKQKNKRQ